MKKALLWKKLDKNNVKCAVCAHGCLILPDRRGVCGVRKNEKGVLYSLVYNKAAAVNIDPIEKKPFFHFLPGSSALSFGTPGCNFRCLNCQNWDLSQGPKLAEPIFSTDITPQELVKQALENNCASIAYTYSEPTIFIEYALDTMKLARKKGLKNVWVSNGFMTPESFELINGFIDANNIDIKSFDEKFYQENCGARLAPVLETCKLMKKNNIWLEITTLIIPTLSDSPEMLEKIAMFIKTELGAETPWHVSAFSPEISWRLGHLQPTSVEILRQARVIGLKAGLKYVYIGNVPGEKGENTYCSKCGKLAIARVNYHIERKDKKGKCARCGTNLDLIL